MVIRFKKLERVEGRYSDEESTIRLDETRRKLPGGVALNLA